jgi:anti-sigma-K factor RskA
VNPSGEWVGAYALDALDEEEREAFEVHLETCELCRREVAQLADVVDVLPLMVDEVRPPAELRDRILSVVGADSALPEQRVRGFPSRRRFMLPAGLAAAAALVLALGIGVLWGRESQNVHTNALDSQVASAMADGAHVAYVRGTGVAPTASAALVLPRHSSEAYLLVQGLPPTPHNKVYQFWLIHGKTVRSEGVFTYSGGTQIVQVHRDSGFPSAGVTLEPGPDGSRLPTSPPVLLGPATA